MVHVRGERKGEGFYFVRMTDTAGWTASHTLTAARLARITQLSRVAEGLGQFVSLLPPHQHVVEAERG